MELEKIKTLESIEGWIIQWKANVFQSEEVLINIKMLIKQLEEKEDK